MRQGSAYAGPSHRTLIASRERPRPSRARRTRLSSWPGLWFAESLLHPQFTFTSPNDDQIDRRGYFERCWPNHESIAAFDLVDVCADTALALVRYQASQSVGPGFGNVEQLEFVDGQVSHIDVYFGRG
jgi:hypothetical protein